VRGGGGEVLLALPEQRFPRSLPRRSRFVPKPMGRTHAGAGEKREGEGWQRGAVRG